MKNYEDFKILYKNMEITNILNIVEECSYAYGGIEQVDYLIIKRINRNGKLVIDKLDIRDLTFQNKRGEINDK